MMTFTHTQKRGENSDAKEVVLQESKKLKTKTYLILTKLWAELSCFVKA